MADRSPEAVFAAHRPLLFSIAYRMLSSVSDAEDVVQEAFLRWQRVDPSEVASPKHYLSRVTTRLSIDRLRAQKARREDYIGPWLPEPLLTDAAPAADEKRELAESVAMAFLVVLENLSPVERAVFLLREVFDYEYAEIARIVDKSEANCRRLLARAKQHLAERRPRFDLPRAEKDRLTLEFFTAVGSGDLTRLETLLSKDAVLYSDGGGKVTAARKPIHGADRVARFLVGLMRKAPEDYAVRFLQVNGEPTLVGYLAGKPFNVVTLEFSGDKVLAVRAVLNPDKLSRLPGLKSGGAP